MTRRVLTLAVATMVLLPACIVREDPKVIARCEDVPAELADALHSLVRSPDKILRRLHQVDSDTGMVFISGEIVDPGDGEKDDGDIATWVVIIGDDIPHSADDNSLELSTTPPLPGTPNFIDTDGYVESRGCVDHDRPPGILEPR